MNLNAHIDYVWSVSVSEARIVRKSFLLTKTVNEQEARERDIKLLGKIAGGDRAAFAEFYDLHSTLMFSVACGILHDIAEAEDVLQDAFVQIWEKAAQYDPALGKPSSWAVTLVRNKAIDRIRASQRRVHLAEDVVLENALKGVDGTFNETVFGHEKATMVHSAILDLPADQRRAIELAYFSGLTQHEIAEKLKEPLGTIKARIRRGLLKLRDQLEGLL
jgi:RNA polymerase sigma-70 factor (ECF subfamily)